MERVIVEIAYTGGNYCAYAPLLPGCASTGDTLDEIKKNIREAIRFHVEGSMEDKGAFQIVAFFDIIHKICRINSSLILYNHQL
ncbi:MAG: type II toxin-antitoxin system HicB family antitoxin [Bacteroidales bacterium]|nr:type II toxin-antitoxin system HicB family antitoxin [Bacteroidales bacterium]